MQKWVDQIDSKLKGSKSIVVIYITPVKLHIGLKRSMLQLPCPKLMKLHKPKYSGDMFYSSSIINDYP